MELFHKIKPHYEAINNILDDLSPSKHERKIRILIDGFPFPRGNEILKNFLSNEKIIAEVDYGTSKDILYEIKNMHYDIIISPIDINTNGENIQKISLKTESVGLVIHKDLVKNNITIEKAMNQNLFIHTKASLEHCMMKSLIKKLKQNGINCKTTSINESELFYILNDKIGYSFFSEEYFEKHQNLNSDLIFMKKPFNLFLNRKAYFLKDSHHMDIYLKNINIL